jgi:hypothetical protein
MWSLKRNHLLTIGITLTVLVCSSVFVRNVNTQSASRQKSQEPDPVVDAVRRGGLREAAKLKRHYVSTQRTTGWAKYDLEALTQTSSDIIVGSPRFASSALTASGEGIVSEYDVTIDQTLKGNLNRSNLIRIEVPGGKVTFDDGSSAEIQTPDLGPIKENETYVWFLKSKDNEPQLFQLIGGGQGLFELSESLVKPRGDKVDTVQKHKDQRAADFLDSIRMTIQKHP